MENDIGAVLYSEKRIANGLAGLAERLVADYSGKDLCVVAVLRGSCIFTADLVRAMPIPMTLEFLSCSSYGDGTESKGEVQLTFSPGRSDIEGKHVLLVDDILDTGRTLSLVKGKIAEMGAASVATCVFLDKPERRVVELEADYRVFEVEDLFVVGYGLDYAGRYRNLPYIAALKPEVASS